MARSAGKVCKRKNCPEKKENRGTIWASCVSRTCSLRSLAFRKAPLSASLLPYLAGFLIALSVCCRWQHPAPLSEIWPRKRRFLLAEAWQFRKKPKFFRQAILLKKAVLPLFDSRKLRKAAKFPHQPRLCPCKFLCLQACFLACRRCQSVAFGNILQAARRSFRYFSNVTTCTCGGTPTRRLRRLMPMPLETIVLTPPSMHSPLIHSWPRGSNMRA